MSKKKVFLLVLCLGLVNITTAKPKISSDSVVKTIGIGIVDCFKLKDDIAHIKVKLNSGKDYKFTRDDIKNLPIGLKVKLITNTKTNYTEIIRYTKSSLIYQAK